MAVFFYRHKHIFGGTSDAVLQDMGKTLLLNVVIGAVSGNIDNWYALR